MPRKGTVPKIEVVADPVYDSQLVTKFINSMMWDGKRSTAQGIFYEAMKKLEEKGGGEGALKLFTKAVENAKPMLEVIARIQARADHNIRKYGMLQEEEAL